MKSLDNTQQPEAETADARPPDIAMMRATASRLLAEDAEEPAADEVHVLISTLRGHLELIIPEVEWAIARQPDDDPALTIPVACAAIATADVRRTLAATIRPGLDSAVRHSRRLARRLNAMCDHFETLGGDPS